MNLNLKPAGVLLLISVFMTACSPFQPQLQESIPDNFQESYSFKGEDNDGIEKWWDNYNATELNQFIDQAMTGSFTLKEAWACLDQVNATATKTGSALYPNEY